jgi:hypothetical protein
VIETVGSTGEAGECQSDAQVALCLSQCNLSSLSLLHIWVAPVANHALKNLTISIPSQMEGYSNIQVTDQTGKAITSKISANKQQVVIAFDQAVTPGSTLEIDFSGVPQITLWNQVLEYGVSAEQEGLAGQIPLGTARVQVPFSS